MNDYNMLTVITDSPAGTTNSSLDGVDDGAWLATAMSTEPPTQFFIFPIVVASVVIFVVGAIMGYTVIKYRARRRPQQQPAQGSGAVFTAARFQPCHNPSHNPVVSFPALAWMHKFRGRQKYSRTDRELNKHDANPLVDGDEGASRDRQQHLDTKGGAQGAPNRTDRELNNHDANPLFDGDEGASRDRQQHLDTKGGGQGAPNRTVFDIEGYSPPDTFQSTSKKSPKLPPQSSTSVNRSQRVSEPRVLQIKMPPVSADIHEDLPYHVSRPEAIRGVPRHQTYAPPSNCIVPPPNRVVAEIVSPTRSTRSNSVDDVLSKTSATRPRMPSSKSEGRSPPPSSSSVNRSQRASEPRVPQIKMPPVSADIHEDLPYRVSRPEAFRGVKLHETYEPPSNCVVPPPNRVLGEISPTRSTRSNSVDDVLSKTSPTRPRMPSSKSEGRSPRQGQGLEPADKDLNQPHSISHLNGEENPLENNHRPPTPETPNNVVVSKESPPPPYASCSYGKISRTSAYSKMSRPPSSDSGLSETQQLHAKSNSNNANTQNSNQNNTSENKQT